MAMVARFSTGNRLLRSLSSSDIELLAPHFMTIVLRVPEDLEVPDKTIRPVYFPDTGFASLFNRRLSEVVESGMTRRLRALAENEKEHVFDRPRSQVQSSAPTPTTRRFEPRSANTLSTLLSISGIR